MENEKICLRDDLKLLVLIARQVRLNWEEHMALNRAAVNIEKFIEREDVDNAGIDNSSSACNI
jgi:hypothetical protein